MLEAVFASVSHRIYSQFQHILEVAGTILTIEQLRRVHYVPPQL